LPEITSEFHDPQRPQAQIGAAARSNRAAIGAIAAFPVGPWIDCAERHGRRPRNSRWTGLPRALHSLTS
jgi:hypothetical protein